ncbi:MAG: hypothetical protein JXR69_06795 [Candidatus Delongbacteria bacterium]|nr:hypothetical protein [Candidatus Delongbacteria bacterium]
MGKQIIQIVLVIILQITSINLVAAYFVKDTPQNVKKIHAVKMENEDHSMTILLKKYKFKKGFCRSNNPLFN